MKYLGFIEEHDDIKCASKFSDLTADKSVIHEDLQKIIAYLGKGEIIFGWMCYVKDIHTKESIEPFAYYTDGVWTWPVYFPYYLSKYPYMLINEEFVDYLKSKNFEMNIDGNIKNIIKETENELNIMMGCVRS